jgi:hypothetical protein
MRAGPVRARIAIQATQIAGEGDDLAPDLVWA